MRRNWPLYALFVLFLTPFLVALYILSGINLRDLKTTQHGIFIDPQQAIDLNTLRDLSGAQIYDSAIKHKWQIVYMSPEPCADHCQQRKHTLSNLHSALGADRERVVVATDHSQDATINDGRIYIIDTAGKFVMYYPADSNPSGLLKDLKKLLKYSHAH